MFDIYVNCYEYGPGELKVDWQFHKQAIYLGGNVDLDRCAIKNVKEAQKRLGYFKVMFAERFCVSHTELGQLPHESFYYFNVAKQIAFLNGCTLFWGEDLVREYIEHTHFGTSRLKKLVTWSKRVPSRITRKFLVNVKSLADRTNVKHVVCGYQGRKKVELYHKGVHVIVLPRGRHKVDL